MVFRAREVFDAFDFVEFPVPKDVFGVTMGWIDEAARAAVTGRRSSFAFGLVPFAHFIRWRGGVVDANFVTEIFRASFAFGTEIGVLDANGRFRANYGFVADGWRVVESDDDVVIVDVFAIVFVVLDVTAGTNDGAGVQWE